MYIMWLASSYMLSATIYRFTELKQKLGANRVPFLLPSQAWYKILSLSRVESTAKRKSEQEGKGRGSQAAVARERKTGKRSLLIKSLERFPSTLFFVSLALTCRFFFFFLYLSNSYIFLHCRWTKSLAFFTFNPWKWERDEKVGEKCAGSGARMIVY